MSEQQACGNCRFWQRILPMSDDGECHHDAPPARLVRLGSAAAEAEYVPAWGITRREDWCGQWGPRPVQQRGEATP